MDVRQSGDDLAREVGHVRDGVFAEHRLEPLQCGDALLGQLLGDDVAQVLEQERPGHGGVGKGIAQDHEEIHHALDGVFRDLGVGLVGRRLQTGQLLQQPVGVVVAAPGHEAVVVEDAELLDRRVADVGIRPEVGEFLDGVGTDVVQGVADVVETVEEADDALPLVAVALEEGTEVSVVAVVQRVVEHEVDPAHELFGGPDDRVLLQEFGLAGG